MVGSEDAQLGKSMCVVGQPSAARLFEPSLENMFVSGLDEA